MPQKLIDQTTIQPDGRPGDDAFTAFAICNDNFEDAEARLVVLEAGGGETGGRLDNEIAARTAADAALGARIDAEHTFITQETADRIAADSALSARILGKNQLINGDFRVWQRGQSFPAKVNKAYTADRWFTESTVATMAVTQQELGAADKLAMGQWGRYFSRVVVAGASGVGHFATFGQNIEDILTFSGGMMSFSGWVRASVASEIALEVIQVSNGVGDNPSVQLGKVSIGTLWTYVTFTAAIPSYDAAIVNGSHFRLRFWLSAGTNWDVASSELGAQNGTFDFAFLQAEQGVLPTPFERRLGATELLLCQRYCRTYQLPVSAAAFVAVAIGATSAVAMIAFEPMRTNPVATLNGNLVLTGAGGGNSAITATNFQAINPGMLTMVATVSGRTSGMSGYINASGGDATITIDAEI